MFLKTVICVLQIFNFFVLGDVHSKLTAKKLMTFTCTLDKNLLLNRLPTLLKLKLQAALCTNGLRLINYR